MNENKIIGDYDVSKVAIKFAGSNNTIKFGKAFKTNRLNIQFEGDSAYIEVGDFCQFNGAVRISSDCRLQVGNSLTAIHPSRYFIGEQTEIVIGDDCMFAGNSIFRTDDSHAIYDVRTGERINASGDIKIGNHVWICEECRVLKNTKIEDGSVIGMSTLLSNCHIANNAMVAGRPWKYLKYNIAWEKPYLGGKQFKEKLHKSKYWNLTCFK